jgi:hypothetical protein
VEIIIFIVAGVVTFLCLGMLGNCLSTIKNVKREENEDE